MAPVSACTTRVHHVPVAFGDVGRLVPPGQVLGGGQHVDQGELVVADGDLLDREPAPVGGLVGRAQVDDGGEPEAGQGAPVGLGQAAKAVGPEKAAPGDLAPVGGRVTAQVTEVDAAVELEVAGGHHPAVIAGRRRRPAFAPCGW